MTICFGRLDSEISYLKKTHTNNGLDGIKKGITKLVLLGWGCERRRGGTTYFSKRDFFSWVLTSSQVIQCLCNNDKKFNLPVLFHSNFVPIRKRFFIKDKNVSYKIFLKIINGLHSATDRSIYGTFGILLEDFLNFQRSNSQNWIFFVLFIFLMCY